jgi:hypothetical protein
MTTTADGFLHLLKAEPTLLDPAPVGFTGRDLEHRRLDEVHPCLRCGGRAQNAYVAATELGPRWLGLCMPCAHWLLSNLTPAPLGLDRP